jgi:hypothetical protein
VSKAVAVVTFDYEGIDKDTKGKLTYLAGQIRKSAKGHITHALEMGEHIHEANDALAHAGCEGRFSEWVKAECGFSRKTAYNYMNAFARFGGNCESLTQFTAEAVYLLAGDDVPEGAIKEALKMADKGERIGLETAKATVEKHCPERTKRKTSGATASSEPSTAPPDLPPEGTANQADQGSQGTGAHWSPPEGVTKFNDKFEPEDASELFKDILEHLRKAVLVLDKLQHAAPNKLHDDVFESLDCANRDLLAWRKSAK